MTSPDWDAEVKKLENEPIVQPRIDDGRVKIKHYKIIIYGANCGDCNMTAYRIANRISILAKVTTDCDNFITTMEFYP